MVDHFTRYNHFIRVSHPFTIAQIATTFIDGVAKLHNLPNAIVSDQDPIFVSKF